MIEANENVDLVTLRRQADFEASQRAGAELRSRTMSPAPDDSSVPASALSVQTAAPVAATVEVQPDAPVPAEPPPRDLRLPITAGLVVLLLVAWFWQRRGATRR